MKKKDINDLRVKSIDELEKLASDIREEISKLKTELKNKKLKNTSLIKNKFDDLARVLTWINLKK